MNIQNDKRNNSNIDFLRNIDVFYNANKCSITSYKCDCKFTRGDQQREAACENSYYKDHSKLPHGSKSSEINSYNPRNYPSYTTCSKYTNKETNKYPVRFENLENNVIQEEMNINNNVKTNVTIKGVDIAFRDKSTYCRPVGSLCYEQFILKTIEKNEKLQKIVKKLLIARQQEKDTEKWNNYIHELRMKHEYTKDNGRTTSLDHGHRKFVNPIEDYYYNTKFACKESNTCQNLLQDFYNANNVKQPCYEYYQTPKENEGTPKVYSSFETNPICFPTSAAGRFILLERERQKQLQNKEYKAHCKTRNHNQKMLSKTARSEENNSKKLYKKRTNSVAVPRLLNSRSTNTIPEAFSVQDEFKTNYPNEDVRREKVLTTKNLISKGICTEEPSKIKIRENKQSCNHIPKQTSLVYIEEKLDTLINSINNFIVEIKTKRCSPYAEYLYRPTKLGKDDVNFTRSDSYGIARKEKIVCRLSENSSRSTKKSSEVIFDKMKYADVNLSKVSDILLHNMERNNLMTIKNSCVGGLYQPCSVQISVNIPTKEISTEVTRSLFKTQCTSGNKTVETDAHKIAIAVNTDPLSLLALLKVSTGETIRKLMSFIPNIDYYYYLTRLHGRQIRAIESHYVCNICGSAFMKPSQLTDHIKRHDFGWTRDCCVCRHVLDMPRRRSGLFKCQYCGQRFTRAYCCELHQQSCATRLGITHDVASSLMYLK